jgi:small-conductance mechanosensitive channel
MIVMIKDILEYHLLSTKSIEITVGGILLALLIVFFNVFFLGYMAKFIIRHFGKKGSIDGRQLSIIQLLKYIMWIFTIVICLQILGIDVTFLIASSAALLVGLGIGMQIIFKDFMSGIILLIEGTIKINDVVEIEGQIMQVKEISLRTSKVMTRDDKVVIIPNHKFIEENVINWTHSTTPTRFVIEVGVDYSSDVKLVEQCLLEASEGHPEIIQEGSYKPFIRFANFGSSSLDFQLIFWSNNLFRIETTKSQIRYKIAGIFSAHQITIPFTQIVMHKAE